MAMAFLLTVMGWLGETVIKSLIDKVWDKVKELSSEGGDGGECGAGNALEDLEISLIRIQPTISKAENMWIKDDNLRQNVNKLLEQLKDATYDAENLLDNFQFRKLQQQIKLQGNEASDISLSHPMKKRKVGEDNGHDDVITEIRKIREKLDNISTAMEKLLSSDNRGKMQIITEINRVTSSIPIETQVFGRNNELKELMRLLLEPDEGPSGSGSGCNIPVLTITGMGGVGKTTLAQQVYNDKRVEEHFELKIWVCVSEDFSVERLTKEIIESATKQKCDDLRNFDALQVVLKEKIASKKFLLVLDDIWNKDKHIWDSLCAPLRSGVTGSKILVTTRNVKIANIVGSVNPIHLNGLDDDNCWAFLKKCAFGFQNSRDHPQLEAIAKEMVPKLKGLPLAARTLGGLLSRNMNEEHWRAIMDSEIWKLPQEEHGVLLVLQLSYQYLPAHLKRCFAFCSLYPKDHLFDEHELVRIWMAEGFFPAHENIRKEDFGSVCFQELVSSSFFQKSQRSNRYVMHDLIHDLAQLISGGETYRVEDGKPFEIPTMLRHLNIVGTRDDEELRTMIQSHAFNKLRTLICSSMNSVLTCEFLNKLERVRTLILNYCTLTELPESIGDFIDLRYLSIDGKFILRKLPNSLFKLSNLQALILQRCILYELPESIGDLIYLRYLDISMNSDLNKLPESLCRLSNLQTLRLCYCDKLQVPPQGMSRLINLRKLDAGDNLVSEITGIGKLKYLQSLSIFKVGKEHGRKITELSGLNQLHGMLRIKCLENVECKEEATAAKLQSKLHLEDLQLQWTKNDAFSDSKEEVLEHLRPNPTLKILTIRGYNGSRSPSWLERESLPKLETLHLENCRRWDDLLFIKQELFGSTESNLFYREWFPCLRVLDIDSCPMIGRFPLLPSSLTRVTLNQVGLTEFPGMQTGMGESSSNAATVSPLVVRISKCPNLTSLDRIEWFPCLKSLDIEDCPLLTRLPPLPPSLEKLQLINVGLIELSGIGGSSSNSANVSLSELCISQCANLTSLEWFPCLKSLDIEDCPLLTRLPPFPPSLEKLQLINIGMIELPGIGGSSSNIADVSLSELCISQCASLRSLEWFPCLKSLAIEDCPLLTRLPPLPPSLVELQLIQVGLIELLGISESSNKNATISLSVLRISKCASLTSLEWFPCLKSLDIDDCPLLTRLPPLPPSLEKLQLIQVGLIELLGISESSNNNATISLSVLQISKCANLTSLEWFPCLKSLDIEDCPLLIRLHPLPPSLEKLQLIRIGLTKLLGINGNSSNVATASPLVVQISKCANLTSLGWFPCLKSLDIEDCPLLTRLPPLPPSLEKLQLIHVGLRKLPGIGGSSSNIATASPLVVRISKCANLTSLESFPWMKSLVIEDCLLLTTLPTLPPSLVELQLIQVGLTELPEIGGSSSNIATVSLSVLHIEECSNMISLEHGLLSYNLPKLEIIFVKNCRELLRMPAKKLKEFTYLKIVSIVNCPKLMSTAQDDDIHLLLPPSIRRLKLSNCGKVSRSLPGCLYNLASLTELELCNCPHLVTLAKAPLLYLEGLEVLCLVDCIKLRSIGGVEVLKSLKFLKIHRCPRLQVNEVDRQGENISLLVALDVDDTAFLRVSPLRNTLPSIETLIINDSLEVNMFEREDQELLRSLTSLIYLGFKNCKNLQSLPTELHALSSLESLTINECTQIQSLPEKGLPISLKSLRFDNCHSTLEMQLKAHREEMKRSGRCRPIFGGIRIRNCGSRMILLMKREYVR